MSYVTNEYNNASAGGPACTYASLGHYNQGMGSGPIAPVPAGVPSMKYQVVPVYGSMGYNALTHGTKVPGCTQYFNIGTAYPSYPNGCTKFTSRLCSG
jgi:hypothetical protein